MNEASSQPDATIHATAVAVAGRAVLMLGPSGAGKSDLALRLIDRGAGLIGDDRILLRPEGHRVLVAGAPALAGLIEVRGVGIVAFPPVGPHPLALALDLATSEERMQPERLPVRRFAGIDVPVLGLDPWTASAAIRVELALARFGLPR